MNQMQAELETTYPLLDIQIAGINRAGLESGNAEMTEGRSIPWLQDIDHNSDGTSDTWTDWGAGHLDLVILDGNNKPVGMTNLSTYGLDASENHAALRETIIDAAMTSQKPWHNAENSLDVDGSGVVGLLDVLSLVDLLTAMGSHRLAPPVADQSPPPYSDVDGDGNATPLDVLRLIDFLNARHAAAAAEGEFVPQPPHPVAADDGSEMLWLGHMDAAVSNSRRSTEGVTSASRDAATEDHVEGPPIEPVWPAQADRLFGSGDIDWREDSSPTVETVSELDLTRELDTLSHAWA